VDVKLKINNVDEILRKGARVYLTEEEEVFGIKLEEDQELIINGEKRVIPKIRMLNIEITKIK
jgi:hypothetical protein